MNKLTLWIARDGDGYLTLNTRKPARVFREPMDRCYWNCPLGDYLSLDDSLCPDLKWEDEPKEITIEL